LARAAERAVNLNPRAGTGGGLHRLNYREAERKPDAADATPSWLRMLIFAAVKVLREARRGASMKSLLISLTSIMVVCASPVCAASCNELRLALGTIDKKIDFVNELINEDAFGSEQASRDLELGKRAIREYIDVASIFLSRKCTDNGRVASSVHIFTTMLNAMH